MAQWSGQPALHCSRTDATSGLVLGWMDGWVDAAAAARDTFLLSPSASAVPPILSGDIIKR